MDIKSIRRTNLKKLVDQEKNQSAFAAKVETTPSYISQLLSSKNSSGIGTNFARRLEEKFKLEQGWMDIDHSEAQLLRVPLTTAEEICGKRSPAEDRERVVISVKASSKSFAFIMQDDSMEPVIAKGWTIVVDPSRKPKQGDIVMLSTKNGVFVREMVASLVGDNDLKPANGRYNIEHMNDSVSMVGVVVESIYRQRLSGSNQL